MSKPAPTTDVEKGETPATDEPAADAPAPSQAVLRSQKRMHQTQAQVDEVTEIMRMNVEKVLERDGMISALDERADALKEGAEMFEKQAGALKSKFWWENMKMIGIMVAVGIIFLLVIFVWLGGN